MITKKKCTDCGLIKEYNEFGNDKQKLDGKYPNCKNCVNRNTKLRSKYRKIYTEPDVCDNCGVSKLEVRNKKLCLDHDHNTGQFRGYLCWECNQGMGKIGDTIESLYRAIDYMKNNSKKYKKIVNVYSADTNKIDKDGGPYKVEIDKELK